VDVMERQREVDVTVTFYDSNDDEVGRDERVFGCCNAGETNPVESRRGVEVGSICEPAESDEGTATTTRTAYA
jgi:hypothetical protein